MGKTTDKEFQYIRDQVKLFVAGKLSGEELSKRVPREGRIVAVRYISEELFKEKKNEQ